MARPRKTVVEAQADIPQSNQPPAERDMAPVTEMPVEAPVVEKEIVYVPVYTPPTPRQMSVERQGATGASYTRRFPTVRGGICEFCGVLDKNVPSQYQYQICEHYRGMQLRCSYCPEIKNPDEVIYHSILNVAEHPDKPGTIIAWCNSFDCSKAHNDRFQRATT